MRLPLWHPECMYNAAAIDIEVITTSDGLGLHVIYEPPTGPDKFMLLCTHGVDSNFYASPYLSLGRRLREDGHGFAIVNNRGHDRMCRISGKLFGSAYEVFEDCVLDLEAAANWLVEKGHRRIILSGHSLGALKVTYMQAFQPHPQVMALAPCSGPCLVEESSQEEFDRMWAEAQQFVDAGDGEHLIWARPPADGPGLWAPFSASTYVNKYGATANTRTLHYITKVKVPTLFIAGGLEKRFARHANDLYAALSGVTPTTVQIIEGATHNYVEQPDAVADTFRSWMATL